MSYQNELSDERSDGLSYELIRPNSHSGEENPVGSPFAAIGIRANNEIIRR
jgi:hypothetical protein